MKNIKQLTEERDALKQKLEATEKDAARWKAFVAEAERDYVEVSANEAPYWQRFECTAAMEEFADNPHAKQATAFKVRDAKEKREAAQTLRDVQSGKPMMGRNQ